MIAGTTQLRALVGMLDQYDGVAKMHISAMIERTRVNTDEVTQKLRAKKAIRLTETQHTYLGQVMKYLQKHGVSL
jgi:hypothetical protein